MSVKNKGGSWVLRILFIVSSLGFSLCHMLPSACQCACVSHRDVSIVSDCLCASFEEVTPAKNVFLQPLLLLHGGWTTWAEERLSKHQT